MAPTVSGTKGRKDEDIKVLCFTWNVGNAKADAEELQHWLPENGGHYDLVVVGTQENSAVTAKSASSASLELSEKSLQEDDDDEDEDEKSMPTAPATPGTARGASRRFKKRESSRRSSNVDLTQSGNAWETMVSERLGDDFWCLAHVTLGEMRLTVYCSREHEDVHDVATARAATGIGGIGFNKGGLVVRCVVGSTSLAFCSCHLAAHEGEQHNNARNEMCRSILKKTMGGGIGGVTGGAPKGRALDVAHSVDHLIWLGDLNYRVDLSLSTQAAADGSKDKPDKSAHHAAVSKLIEEEKWDALIGADQLRHSRAAGDAFVGFTEGDMKFSPTFKVQRKGGVLYKKQRTPSYCDRVLWKTLVPKYASQVRQMLLNGVVDVTTSDHKPVVSALHIAPTPQIEFSKEVEATINLSQLKLTDIMAADLGLTSDPYCRFYTHPPGLLKAGKQGAKTPVIFFVGKNAKVNPLTACCIGAYSEDSVERLKGGNNVCQWKDHNVPHLHLHAPLEKLKDAVLIITVFDFNRFRPDEPLGVVTVPLGPPAIQGTPIPKFNKRGTWKAVQKEVSRRSRGDESSRSDDAYVIAVDEPIVFGHSTTGTGRLSCKLQVSKYDPAASGGFMSRLLGGRHRRTHEKAAKLEGEGDYMGAAKALEKENSAMSIEDEDVSDPDVVRLRVQDLTRLAEMKWRYKVVDKGESAHDAALDLLTRAKGLINRHREHVLAKSAGGNVREKSTKSDRVVAAAAQAGKAMGGVSKAMRSSLKTPPPDAEGASSAAGDSVAMPTTPEAFRMAWAKELSAVLQGLCATRVIFKTGKESEVEADLLEAISLQEGAGLEMELGASLNSLGELKKKGGNYDEAEQHFTRSLSLRRGHKLAVESDDEAHAKDMAVAQSLVSLGNLHTERGDKAQEAGESAQAKASYAKARGFLEESKDCYVRGAGGQEMHPRVAWALEALGRLNEKEGNIDDALTCFEKATDIRTQLQKRDESIECFTKELADNQSKMADLRRQRGLRPDRV